MELEAFALCYPWDAWNWELVNVLVGRVLWVVGSEWSADVVATPHGDVVDTGLEEYAVV